MTRLRTDLVRSGSGPSIPWKVVALILLIGGIWAFIGYKYVQYRVPNRTPAQLAATRNSASAPKARASARPQRAQPSQQFLALVKQLDLSEAQKEQIEKVASQTTAPRTLRAEVNKILTPEQQAQLKRLQEEAAAKRAEQQKARAARMQKYYGNEAQYAQQADATIRRQREERRRAAESPAPPPAAAQP